MTTHRFYNAGADRYAAGIDPDCDACRRPCPEHGVKTCRLCHTHPGECGYGGCTAAEQLIAVDYWQDNGTVAQRRTLCVRHMRWWRHECLDGVDRTVGPLDASTGRGPVSAVRKPQGTAAGETLASARLALRQLREEAEYAGLCVEMLTASLHDAGLDATTRAEVAEVGDAVTRMSDAAAAALVGLDSRHTRWADAVNATPHAAKTSFYRRGGQVGKK